MKKIIKIVISLCLYGLFYFAQTEPSFGGFLDSETEPSFGGESGGSDSETESESESKEELEEVKSEGKAPTYNGNGLKSHNEKGKLEATTYEFKSKTTKTPSDSRSGVKGGSYEGTPSGKISKKKDDPVITKYSPLLEQIRDELRSLADRQRIGRRKMRFRL